eukprot:s223_g53.t1
MRNGAKQALATLKREPLVGWQLGWTTKVLPHLDPSGALDLLQRLHVARIPIHVFHCVQAISLCSRSAAWSEALTALGMCKPLSAVAVNATMAACANASQWHLALTLLQDMQAEQIATAISFSSAINACAKAFLWQRSIHLLTEMQMNGFSRNTIAFNAALSSCAMGAQWQAALGLFAAMAKKKLQKTTITFNAVITACEKAARWQVALRLFSFAKPDVVSCSAAISACEKGTRWRQALHLLGFWQKLR